MSETSGIRARAAELVSAFEARGAEAVEADILQPAGPLLDLYGEDIRARAFVTSDPMRGEAMLRPDFTVPVVQRHLGRGAAEGVYTYAGEVFRKQPEGSERPVEYLQVGYERLGRADRAQEDAEVFAAFHALLAPLGLVPTTGDIGLLLAAVRGLRTTEARKSALARHLWRPRRFRALLERFRAPGVVRQPTGSPDSPEIGLRTREDVAIRMQALAEDAAAPPLSATEAEMLEALLALRSASGDALSRLRDIAVKSTSPVVPS
jgi:ATP phosphoribosyltransferase regulatory subunit